MKDKKKKYCTYRRLEDYKPIVKGDFNGVTGALSMWMTSCSNSGSSQKSKFTEISRLYTQVVPNTFLKLKRPVLLHWPHHYRRDIPWPWIFSDKHSTNYQRRAWKCWETTNKRMLEIPWKQRSLPDTARTTLTSD